MALLLQTLFQTLFSLKYFISFKVAFKGLGLEKTYFKNLFGKIGKNGNFTLLNKAMFVSYRTAFRSVSKYYMI